MSEMIKDPRLLVQYTYSNINYVKNTLANITQSGYQSTATEQLDLE